MMESATILKMVVSTLRGLLEKKDDEIAQLKKENELLKKRLKVDAVFIDSIFDKEQII